ncbi:hypothetical protein NON08_12835 [Cetobacterium somerae]|uniref:hypothetical protein n=1 Tax=Cetobacterium sp. NK01 TaxID=2993530 RepID=UPI00211661FF|nr:hypothetical protein [Cetobacterium sp. NK01]MCQ8213387.1 hypothetical protein [Cetobacterium sp. NK01]
MGAIDRLRRATEGANKEISEKENKIKTLEIIKNIAKIDFSKSEEENEFLEVKTKEILNLQANASIQLGRIFKEVSEKIQEDMTYCQWLDLIGFNRMTALRHKRRFELFENTNNDIAKEIVGSLTFREIEQIYKNLQENLIYLNTSNSIIEFKSILKEKNLIEKKEVKKEIETNINFEIFNDIKEKILNVDKKKKEEIEKLLLKIEKLLKS